MASQTVTLPATIANETRQIEFRVFDGCDKAFSGYVAMGRVAAGGKLWPMALTAWRKDGAWTVSYGFQMLNRNGQAVAWDDGDNANASHHSGSAARR